MKFLKLAKKNHSDPMDSVQQNSFRRHTDGMALVLVLAVLVLFSGLVLAIFFTSRMSRQSSSLFASSVEARFLVDTSVNLCMTQITDATGEKDRAWISQPGLIRTFTGNRNPAINYRLYSWSDLRPSGAFDPFSTANAVPSDWPQKKALYVDLNEPEPDLDAPTDVARDKYPILYPPSLTASGNLNVAGYSIMANSAGAGDDQVPMPVQWLYVLKDGTVKPAAFSGNDSEVTVADATSENPIVGRIAFWADDESSKVNVNTAAGGLFWMPPWFETAAERTATGPVYGYGFSQPLKNEFQRYPGHPARTDLRAVFPELTWEEIYQLTPRVIEGGSKNGTVKTLAQAISPTQDTDRLFASLGELGFSARKENASGPRVVQASAFASVNDAEWENLVEKRKGFLTISSRAPEMTLFGTPRVAIWPIPKEENNRTALDKLIAFCSTISTTNGADPFYFVRQDPFSANELSSPQTARNEELYRYLQRLTERPFPGLSNAAFSAKFGGARGRDQILTEIFDYIRSTNLQDMQLDSAKRFSNKAVVVPTQWNAGNGDTTGFGRTFSIRQLGFLFICTASGADSASNVPPNDPAGSPYNLSLDPYPGGKLAPDQRRIQVLFLNELFSPSAGFKMFAVNPLIKITGLDAITVNGIPLGFPASGSIQCGASFSNTTGLMGANGGAICWRWPLLASKDEAYDVKTTGALLSSSTDQTKEYPFISMPFTVTVDPGNPEMTISGGGISIEFYDVDSGGNPSTLLNKIDVEIPSTVVPIPELSTNKFYWAFHQKGIHGNSTGRMAFATHKSSGPKDESGMVTHFDVLQMYILPHGDYRSLFGPKNISQNLRNFVAVPAPGTESATPGLRHFLSDFDPVFGSYVGTTYAPGVKWSSLRPGPPMLRPADYPSGVNAPWDFGDWDAGSPISVIGDGPLINKPDEGSVFQLGTINPYANQYSDTASADIATYGTEYHSANRQMPSPVMFGSLPTGLINGQPWQTLLFRPPLSGHPGASDPPDHLLLDLFWMPVVEPYAISERFSTAGKVNMNYQMIPFTYIERSTALRAILQDEKIIAVTDSKWGGSGYAKQRAETLQPKIDYAINVQETLTPFREKFASGAVFLAPSEITGCYLVPDGGGATYSTMENFWSAHRTTGEDIRERPYAYIYPRLTTKSNVFNVHYRVQTLRKRPDSNQSVWNEGRDHVIAELRGSTLIERFLDMNRDDIPDFATDPNASAESLYRFRVLSNKEFNP